MTDKPWQVLLYLGDPQHRPTGLGLRVIDVTDAVGLSSVVTPEGCLRAFTESGISTGDVRSRTGLVVDSRDVDGAALTQHALITFALATGFSGRRIDLLVDGLHLDTAALHSSASGRAALRPEVPPVLATAGYQIDGVPVISIDDLSLTPEAAGVVKFARRVQWLPSSPLMLALGQLIVLAGLRLRDSGDRFPTLVLDPMDESRLVDLDALRRDAGALRRSGASAGPGDLASAVPPTSRMVRLQGAAAADLELVMTALGARQDSTSGDWHCPRPERHTNGDRNASMKVSRGRTRCYRCDAERVDALRLVMDCKGVGPDEAATWIESLESVTP